MCLNACLSVRAIILLQACGPDLPRLDLQIKANLILILTIYTVEWLALGNNAAIQPSDIQEYDADG